MCSTWKVYYNRETPLSRFCLTLLSSNVHWGQIKLPCNTCTYIPTQKEPCRHPSKREPPAKEPVPHGAMYKPNSTKNIIKPSLLRAATSKDFSFSLKLLQMQAKSKENKNGLKHFLYQGTILIAKITKNYQDFISQRHFTTVEIFQGFVLSGKIC